MHRIANNLRSEWHHERSPVGCCWKMNSGHGDVRYLSLPGPICLKRGRRGHLPFANFMTELLPDESFGSYCKSSDLSVVGCFQVSKWRQNDSSTSLAKSDGLEEGSSPQRRQELSRHSNCMVTHAAFLDVLSFSFWKPCPNRTCRAPVSVWVSGDVTSLELLHSHSHQAPEGWKPSDVPRR